MKHFKLKDPGSAITHFIGMLMAMFAATPLILRAMRAPDTVHVISLSIFIVSMILLYAASTTYHTFDCCWHWSGALRFSALFLSFAGLHVRNGFLLCYTLPWAGSVSLHLHRF